MTTTRSFFPKFFLPFSYASALQSIQYNTTLAITGAIKGTSEEKLFNGLGLEYFKDEQWMRGLYHKILNLKPEKYL